MDKAKIVAWLRNNYKKIIIWALGACAMLLLFTVLILPGIIRHQAEKAIFESTGRAAHIEKISINPLTLTVTVQGFRFFEADRSTPFVEFGSIRTSLSLASLYHFAPVVDSLTVQTPRIHLMRTAANRYNFSDILEYRAKQPKSSPKSTALFSINNISITQGSIDFDDKAIPGGRQHTIRDLHVVIPFISNIPYLAEQYADPKLSALVNGTPFGFRGKAKPLAKSAEAAIHIKLDKLDLPHYLAYLPAEIPIKLKQGNLTLDLDLNYKVHASKNPELTISGLTHLDNIEITEKGGSPLLAFNRLEVKTKAIELFRRLVDLDNVSLDGLSVQIMRDAQGVLNFQKLLPAEKIASGKRTKTPKPAGTELAPRLRVASIGLRNGSVVFHDSQPKGGFRVKVSDISVKATNISNEKETKTDYEISLHGDGGEIIAASGSAAISPVSVATSFELKDIKLQRGWPYLQTVLTAPLKGTLGIKGAAEFSIDNGLNLHDTTISLQHLTTNFGDKDGVELSKIDLGGISFNQLKNRAEIGEIRLGKGKVAVSRESDGSVSPLKLLAQQPQTSTQIAAPKQKPVAVKGEKQLSWLIKKIDLNGLSVTFRDKQFQEPPVFSLTNIRLATGNLSGPTFSPMPVRFDATFGANAPLKAVGTLTPLPFRYKGSVQFARLPIKDFEEYVPDTVNIFFVGGTLDSTMQLDLALDSANRPTGTFGGSAGVRGLHLIDSVQEEDLLKWESLQLDDIKGNLAPFDLSIRQIALNGIYSRIAIRKDGALNLQNLITKESKAPSGPAAGVEQSPGLVASAQAQPAVAPPSIRVDSLTIQDGSVLFSDAHLPQQFRTMFYKLGGRVSGLSSEMNQFADVDLRGNLENYSPLLIKGRINPLRNDLFVDLTISFKDIDLTPTTPYAGTYLGYAIDRGKLSLDLKYHIENKTLKAENKVFVDQFTFGQSVDSDKATKLPVRLGIALLKDRNGEIHLDLPVSGRTDDPKFNIWGVVWQVVVNLFVKAATSPFALLSSMMGSSQDLSSVSFAPGSSTLAPPEQQKLTLLAKALTDRPALKVEIKGFVDRERDTEGYRNELLNRKMRQEKLLELTKSRGTSEGLAQETIEIIPAEYSRYLKEVYLKEKFPKPRNLIGMLKDIPDAEMKKLIISYQTVGEQELRQLANDRVAAVRNHLIVGGKVPQERLFQKADDIYKRPMKETDSPGRVELNPVVQ